MTAPALETGCYDCGCLPGDFAPGGPAVRLLRVCGCECHPPEEQARMRPPGARQGGPLPPDDPEGLET